jgi:hypothetical protein
MTTATMLVRTDCPCFRLHLGNGASEKAAALSAGHCFDVVPLFAVSRAPGNAAEGFFADIVSELGGAPLGNGWFKGVALDALAAAVVRRCAEHNAIAIAEKTDDELPVSKGEGSLESSEEEDQGTEDIWEYVEECAASLADKAVTVREALEELVGKKCAKKILSCTRATVAKDAAGHKNRILRVGGAPIRLIPSVPDGAGS